MQSQTVQRSRQARPGTTAPAESTLADTLTDPLEAPAQRKPAAGRAAPVQRMGIDEKEP